MLTPLLIGLLAKGTHMADYTFNWFPSAIDADEDVTPTEQTSQEGIMRRNAPSDTKEQSDSPNFLRNALRSMANGFTGGPEEAKRVLGAGLDKDKYALQEEALREYLSSLTPSGDDRLLLDEQGRPAESFGSTMRPERVVEEEVLVEEEPVRGLMDRMTSEQRSALSDKGSEVNIARQHTITDTQGNFSNAELRSSVDKTIRNPVKRGLLSGMMQVEVGDRGPVTETGYSRANVAAMSPTSAWGRRMVRDGVMTPDGDITEAYSADNVFNSVYANRLGNGDFASGDGSRFKGRGLVQLTGRNTYQAVQDRLNAQGMDVDLIANPDLVNDDRYALPAALAYLDYKGLTDDSAEAMTTKKLNNLINSGAPRATAEERWDSVVAALREAGMEDKADEMALRNEYDAQEAVGTTVDGAIGPASRAAMRSWLTRNSVSIPADATDTDLVVLVNRNS